MSLRCSLSWCWLYCEFHIVGWGKGIAAHLPVPSGAANRSKAKIRWAGMDCMWQKTIDWERSVEQFAFNLCYSLQYSAHYYKINSAVWHWQGRGRGQKGCTVRSGLRYLVWDILCEFMGHNFHFFVSGRYIKTLKNLKTFLLFNSVYV